MPPFEGSIVIHVLIVFIGLIGELGQIGLILYTVRQLFGVQTSAWRGGIRMPHRKPYDARHENNQEQGTYPFFAALK
jgi:hypothetical protein